MASCKYNSAGMLALTYCKSLHSQGLLNSLLSKGGGNRDKFDKTMTAEFDAEFRDGPAFQHKVPLNKFMVDWDIKDFLGNYVGYNSWEDLENKSKKAGFKHYPRRKCPEWHEISHESYYVGISGIIMIFKFVCMFYCGEIWG